MKLGVVSAAALVSGFRPTRKLSTVSGDIVVDNHAGDVELSSVSGELSVGNHIGRITAHTVSGDVVATGDMRSFNADTVSGDMILDARGTPDRVDTNTVSGDLTVRFDAGHRRALPHQHGRRHASCSTTRPIKGMLGKGFERVTGELAGTLARPRREQRLGQHLGHAAASAVPARQRGCRGRDATARRRERSGAERPTTAARGMTPAVFAHGNLRLYLLALLEERPRHGYELIQALSDRFGGTYSPSAGTIYPRLVEARGGGPRHQVAPTAARPSTRSRTPAAPSSSRAGTSSTRIEDDVTDSVRRLADGVRAEVNDAMRSLRAELASAAREAKRTATSASAHRGGAPRCT